MFANATARPPHLPSCAQPVRTPWRRLPYHAYHVLDSYIVGYTRQETGYVSVPDNLSDLVAAFLRQLSATEYPYFAEHVMQHLEPTHGDLRAFEFGLDLILDSLDRLREVS
jgi:Tetracyclin repressor-like, C-terminal domain